VSSLAKDVIVWIPKFIDDKGGIVGDMLWVLVVGGFFNDGGVLQVSS
jgi:hypothetical protein